MKGNKMDQLEDLIENCDNIVVNYNSAKYTPKETLINTAIGAGVGLVCVGIILGVGRGLDALGTALYRRHERKIAQTKANQNPEKD